MLCGFGVPLFRKEGEGLTLGINATTLREKWTCVLQRSAEGTTVFYRVSLGVLLRSLEFLLEFFFRFLLGFFRVSLGIFRVCSS